MALNHLKQKIHLRKETKVMKKLMNKKGFTLMEMLIVVAIIVILVAIAIPTFSSSLDDAKKATDDANLRAAKAVALNNETMNSWGNLVSKDDETTTLYFDVDNAVFVTADAKDGEGENASESRDKGQSSDNSSKYITITFKKGVMQGNPEWK